MLISLRPTSTLPRARIEYQFRMKSNYSTHYRYIFFCQKKAKVGDHSYEAITTLSCREPDICMSLCVIRRMCVYIIYFFYFITILLLLMLVRLATRQHRNWSAFVDAKTESISLLTLNIYVCMLYVSMDREWLRSGQQQRSDVSVRVSEKK